MRPEILERIEELVDTIASLKDKSIKVYISISYERSHGHDRHFSTQTGYNMLVNYFGITMSGAQVFLEQDESTRLGISADALADFSIADDGKITFIEHFEEKTERRTTIIPMTKN